MVSGHRGIQCRTGIIDKARRTSRASDFWGIKEKAQLSQETRNFVPKFVAIALIATNPKKYGFNNCATRSQLEFDEVDAEGLLKFDAAAEMAEADAAIIKELNPALLRNLTPPGARGYRLRVQSAKAWYSPRPANTSAARKLNQCGWSLTRSNGATPSRRSPQDTVKPSAHSWSSTA
jgi:membrane-bound lytic murein transglycosylase D